MMESFTRVNGDAKALLSRNQECRGPQPSAGVRGVPEKSPFLSPPQAARKVTYS